ncbi:MAG: hypothetical protein GXO73_04035 [Calditrichaeota bacterium]|nr:hypothetical protein [Calditrichota bacterium]
MADLIVEEPRERDGRVELAARFVSSSGEHRLWYRVELSRKEALARNADPFVLGTTHLAMQTGEDVFVHGEVSPSLLENIEVLQQAWSTWRPHRYRQVEIRAVTEVEPDLPPRHAAISSFSGGVDSCFTAFRHARGLTTRFPQPLRASVMVHGFDIPLDDEDGYRRATAKAERQLASLDIELYRVTTNFRELPVNWVDSFGAAVASVLALFQGSFTAGLLPSGVPFGAYRSLVEGSNPITDPMLSSAAFRIVADGAGFSRIEKIATIARWQAGIDDLRVCGVNQVRYENCGVCEKCIRNILSFRALGFERPTSFSKDVTEEQILELVPLKEIKIEVGYRDIVQVAQSNGLSDEAWVRALRKAIRLSRLYHLLCKFRGGRRVWRFGRVTKLLS